MTVANHGDVGRGLKSQRGFFSEGAGRTGCHQRANLGEFQKLERMRIHVVSQPAMLDPMPNSIRPDGYVSACEALLLMDSVQTPPVRNHTRSGQGVFGMKGFGKVDKERACFGVSAGFAGAWF